MLLYNTCLYVFTRDICYGYYCLYALSVNIYLPSVTGIGDWLVWGQSDFMRMHSFGLSANISFLMATLFVRHFLSLKELGSWYLHLNTFFIVYWIISIGIYLSGSLALAQVSGYISLLSCIVVLIKAGILWSKGKISAKYFTIAWSGLIVLTFVSVLMMAGRIPHTILTKNGSLIGFVTEMILLSIALVERINRERVAREVAQAESLRIQTMMIKSVNANTRTSDFVARYGGEKFAVILPSTKEKDAFQIAERLRHEIEQIDFICAGNNVPLSASLGIASTASIDEITSENLIQKADQALYQAQNNGRNCSATSIPC